MYRISIIIGKSLLALLRLAGRRGSALPGLVVERINKSFLKKTIGTLPGGVIIVTGTNGKTTTTKILAKLLEGQGMRVLTNETGSNFVRGIIATVIEKIRLSGKLDYDIAVIEQDEAYAALFVNYVRPRGLVALNVMRDQMDRFGEIDATARLIAKTAESVSEFLVLNANDPRIAVISKSKADAKTVWFGHHEELVRHFVSDDQHHHGDAIEFYEAAEPDVELRTFEGSEVNVKVGSQTLAFRPKLEGGHNALNLTAALAAFTAVCSDYSKDALIHDLENISPAFGRGEQIILKNGCRIHLQLVKNPSGFTHSLRILQNKRFDLIGIAINDDYADGRDVSWLWDVEFHDVAEHGSPVICAGIRGNDMALRILYENGEVEEVITEDRIFIDKLVSQGQSDEDYIIFCTYTSMLSLRKLLKKHSTVMNEEGL